MGALAVLMLVAAEPGALEYFDVRAGRCTWQSQPLDGGTAVTLATFPPASCAGVSASRSAAEPW